MKIFISWSGSYSKEVAEGLSKWLPRMFPAVEPFYSDDNEKGMKWLEEIGGVLESTPFGIVCLTPDNLESRWIHYEAGALSKTKDARVCTLLLGLKPIDVPFPLKQFQHTVAEKYDILKMLRAINTRLGDLKQYPLTEQILMENYEVLWPLLEQKLEEAKPTNPIGNEPLWVPHELHHVSLTVRDLEKSKAFYRDVLGLTEIEKPDIIVDGIALKGAWFELQNKQQLHLIVNPEGTFRKPGKNKDYKGKYYRDCHFALRVRNYNEAWLHMNQKRIEILPDATGSRKYALFYILDPDKHIIEINAGELHEPETKPVTEKH